MFDTGHSPCRFGSFRVPARDSFGSMAASVATLNPSKAATSGAATNRRAWTSYFSSDVLRSDGNGRKHGDQLQSTAALPAGATSNASNSESRHDATARAFLG